MLENTQADGLMIGRAAYGNPWIFTEIKAGLTESRHNPVDAEVHVQSILNHVSHIHEHYGDFQGVRIARKHIGWYLDKLQLSVHKKAIFGLESSDEQLQELQNLLLDITLPKVS